MTADHASGRGCHDGSTVLARYCRPRESSTAQRLKLKSETFACDSVTWVNASVKPVLAVTSNKISGRSTRGSRTPPLPEGPRGSGLFQPIEGRQDEFAFAFHHFETHGGVGRKARRDCPVGVVQFFGQRRHHGTGILGKAKCSTDDRPCRLPFRTGKQAGAGVRVAPARADKDISAFQRRMKLM